MKGRRSSRSFLLAVAFRPHTQTDFPATQGADLKRNLPSNWLQIWLTFIFYLHILNNLFNIFFCYVNVLLLERDQLGIDGASKQTSDFSQRLL